MADAAMYAPITDNLVTLSLQGGEGEGPDFNTTFNLPQTLDVNARSVLMISVRTFQSSQNLGLDVLINNQGTDSKFLYNLPASEQFIFQEVLPNDLLERGQNRIEFRLTGDGGSARISDVVLLYGVNL